MKIEIIPVQNKEDLQQQFVPCQHIVEENLEVNGGTLKQDNLIEQDYKWSHLVLLKKEEDCLGFALIRFSEYDQHRTSFDNYYYISQIAISKKFQKMGLGSVLLNYILENITEYPVVASVNKKNTASLALFQKNMVAFGETSNYFRFIEEKYYSLSQNNINKGNSI